MKILDCYKNFFSVNNITLDSSQEGLVALLANLHEQINSYKLNRSSTLKRTLMNLKVPKGIYIYGDVGQGKSMLVNLFFDLVNLEKKYKIHFHAFMAYIHKLFHQHREKADNSNYIVESIAKDLVSKYRLLYIDDLEIRDVTDAMIFSKLFDKLSYKNITIIITSNKKPQDLYKDGLRNEEFNKFIKLIEDKLDLFAISAKQDYRDIKDISTIKLFYVGAKQEQFIADHLKRLIGNRKLKPQIIKVNNREVICQTVYKKLAVFDFIELFSNNLNSHDYYQICLNFKIVLIKNIKKIEDNNENTVRRFINFFDIAYDQQIVIVASANIAFENIYDKGKSIFELKRTLSRIKEMRSVIYEQKYNQLDIG